MHELAKSIIALRLSTRRACMCEGKGNTKKNTLSLKTKVLFLISEGCGVKQIIASLFIAKTNLALLTRDMAEEGLIVKTKGSADRREVNFALTELGRAYLDERLAAIEENVGFKDSPEAEKIIEAAIMLLDGTSVAYTDED